MKSLSLEQGKRLVVLARKSVSSYFSNGVIKDDEFSEKRGVFVTLHTLDNELRGCIGFPNPTMPLSEAVIKAAIFAAFNDPRFESVKENELNALLFEVSVLTRPELIKVNNYKDYFNEIKIGRDGLIVEADMFKGLLLPQVAVSNKWNVEKFLENTCVKAGLIPETWRYKCKVYKFQTQIFKEASVNGDIVEAKPKSF